ncbi:MAG: DoxX family protein [Pseudomonadota bacterium]
MYSKITQLIKFMFTGDRKFEWLPIFVARFSLGLFFAVSGYNKLFVPEKHADLIHLMGEIGMPFPEFMALFLAAVEFYGGILLMLGLFSSIWAVALTIAMIVAIITVEIDAIIPKGIGFLDWMSWFLYLPQVMYVILFVWLIITGPGKFSLDYLLANKLKLDRN